MQNVAVGVEYPCCPVLVAGLVRLPVICLPPGQLAAERLGCHYISCRNCTLDLLYEVELRVYMLVQVTTAMLLTHSSTRILGTTASMCTYPVSWSNMCSISNKKQTNKCQEWRQVGALQLGHDAIHGVHSK